MSNNYKKYRQKPEKKSRNKKIDPALNNSGWSVLKACKKCNLSKGRKRLYEWFGLKQKDSIPRIAEGKYLKLLDELHNKYGTLDINKDELKQRLCPNCDMKKLCVVEGKEGKLTVYCLEGIFNKLNKGEL